LADAVPGVAMSEPSDSAPAQARMNSFFIVLSSAYPSPHINSNVYGWDSSCADACSEASLALQQFSASGLANSR
jgi:hypothetical protein